MGDWKELNKEAYICKVCLQTSRFTSAHKSKLIKLPIFIWVLYIDLSI